MLRESFFSLLYMCVCSCSYMCANKYWMCVLRHVCGGQSTMGVGFLLVSLCEVGFSCWLLLQATAWLACKPSGSSVFCFSMEALGYMRVAFTKVLGDSNKAFTFPQQVLYQLSYLYSPRISLKLVLQVHVWSRLFVNLYWQYFLTNLIYQQKFIKEI